MAVDLDALAGDPDLMGLWREIHRRMCSGTQATSLSTVRVRDLTPGGVATLRSWLDTAVRRRAPSSVKVASGWTTVPVRKLLAALALSEADLVDLVERAVGAQVVDLAAARRNADQQRTDLWTEAETALGHLPQLLARLRAAGVTDPDDVLDEVMALAAALAHLPSPAPVTLAKLAHDLTGDPHYFDLDTLPGRRLVLGISELLDEPAPELPHMVRALLARAGVVADRLSATVLLHQVAVAGHGVIDDRLRRAHLPVPLNLAELTEDPPTFVARQTLTVVENPSVLEGLIALF